jgi:isopentenyl phosphate kinase
MLTFLKLGGSLITDKDTPFSARKQTIKRLGMEIAYYLDQFPDHQLLIGHGSGSFGHAAASQFGTINGVHSEEEWRGFQSVWWAAHHLNQIVCELLIEVGLPIISLPASGSISTTARKISKWNTTPIEHCVRHRLIPVIFGDVIFDMKIGGTILSTEELFTGLIDTFKPNRILLAGIDDGVFRDFPANHDLLSHITPSSFQRDRIQLEKSANTDVTGGMAAKVEQMLQAVTLHKGIEIQIFSGEQESNLNKALCGEKIGTIICASF